MNGSSETLPRAIVVGSGAGGASAAKELAGRCRVTILEAGGEFRPLALSLPQMERLRDLGLLFDERVISLVFPSMRVRRTTGGIAAVWGAAAGGTTLLSTGNALRMDGCLREIGLDLAEEFDELSHEIPVSTAHERFWSGAAHRLYEICARYGLAPRVTPKLVDFSRCRRCGRCVLGCPNGAKWDARRFLDDAEARGAELRCRQRVARVVIRGSRAVGVEVRRGRGTSFLAADLVVLAAGGLGTPSILERSGIRCEPRLSVDPVLCIAAPVAGGTQYRELPMPFIVQRQGYMISPYFDYLSFLFDKGWRCPAGSILGLMVKLADSQEGSVTGRGGIEKGLSALDRERLSSGERLCRELLREFGADPAAIFTGTLNAGHPGGTLPLTASDADSLHPARLPANLYVADSSLLPRALGNPPILTILALARRVARAALRDLGASDSSPAAFPAGCRT